MQFEPSNTVVLRQLVQLQRAVEAAGGGPDGAAVQASAPELDLEPPLPRSKARVAGALADFIAVYDGKPHTHTQHPMIHLIC